MRRIERFTLLRPDDNSDPCTADSQLISDGQVTSVGVPGIEILHQFDTVAGYLLVTDHDCPFEETFHFILLDQHLRIRSRRSLGAGFSFVPTSGWFGGRMVYEQGMRVKGVSPVEHAPEAKMLPGDERVEHALHAVERYAPSSGPMLH